MFIPSKFKVKIIPVGHLHFWATARPRGNCCQNDNDTTVSQVIYCFLATNIIFEPGVLLNFAFNWFWVKNRVKKKTLCFGHLGKCHGQCIDVVLVGGKKHKLHFNMFQPPLCLLEPQAAVKAEAVKMHTR